MTGQTVWVVLFVHGHGYDATVVEDEEMIEEVKADWAESFWEDEFDDPMPTRDEVSGEYFSRMEDRSGGHEYCEVIETWIARKDRGVYLPLDTAIGAWSAMSYLIDTLTFGVDESSAKTWKKRADKTMNELREKLESHQED